MKAPQLEILWNDAQNLSIQEVKEKQKESKKHARNIRKATNDFWNLLGSKDFRGSDFYDTCSNYGIDTDDLLNALI